MSGSIDPNHNDTRAFLRFLGPAIAGVGLVFLIVGLVNFFSAFGGMEPPRLFWCFFVGGPLLAAGTGITKFAYIGAVARYVANETAPVGKDLTNYMVDGTKGSIRDVATALGEGFAAARTAHSVDCQQCGAGNDTSANFCRNCGSPLAQTKQCSKCGDSNDAGARFCDNCGTAFV